MPSKGSLSRNRLNAKKRSYKARKSANRKSLRGGAAVPSAANLENFRRQMAAEHKAMQSHGLKPLSNGQIIRRIDNEMFFRFTNDLASFMNRGFISDIEDKFKELDALVSGLEVSAQGEQEGTTSSNATLTAAQKTYNAIGLKSLTNGQLIRRFNGDFLMMHANDLARVINGGFLSDIDDNFKKLDSRLARLEAAAPALSEEITNVTTEMTAFERQMATTRKAMQGFGLKPLSKGQIIRRINNDVLISFNDGLVSIINGGLISDMEDKFKGLEARLKRLGPVERV